jgi:hypothetical protein
MNSKLPPIAILTAALLAGCITPMEKYGNADPYAPTDQAALTRDYAQCEAAVGMDSAQAFSGNGIMGSGYVYSGYAYDNFDGDAQLVAALAEIIVMGLFAGLAAIDDPQQHANCMVDRGYFIYNK